MFGRDLCVSLVAKVSLKSILSKKIFISQCDKLLQVLESDLNKLVATVRLIFMLDITAIIVSM